MISPILTYLFSVPMQPMQNSLPIPNAHQYHSLSHISRHSLVYIVLAQYSPSNCFPAITNTFTVFSFASTHRQYPEIVLQIIA